MVEYATNPAVPGRLFFRCDRMRATLSTSSCADMWRKANGLDGAERSAKAAAPAPEWLCSDGCKCCPLGAVHAGEVAASMSPLKGTMTCARCHRGSSRLIRGHTCPSCYNREREVVAGRNAKGTAPVKHSGLHARRIRFRCGDDLRLLRLDLSADTDELVVAALRDSRQRVVFGQGVAIPPGLRQARLW